MTADPGPYDPDERERRLDELHREAAVRRWIERALGPGPWAPDDHRRALDALAVLVRRQRAAGVPTVLDRTAPPPPPRCWECGGPLPDGATASRSYCSQACQKEAYRRGDPGRAAPATRRCALETCRRRIPDDAHPQRRYCTDRCRGLAAQRAWEARRREAEASGAAPRRCGGCEAELPPGDGRRRYCTRTCGRRAASRRWRARQAARRGGEG